MTRLLSTAAALLLAAGIAHAQQSPAPNATAPANPAYSGTAMQRGTLPPAAAPAPMPAAAPAATPARAPRAQRHARPHRAAAAHRPMRRGAATAGRGAPREQGSSAVDALNDQSLARARGAQ